MERIDDSDPRIQYAPLDAWTSASRTPCDWMGTSHTPRSTLDVNMTYQFQGQFIGVYGTVNSSLLEVPGNLFYIDDKLADNLSQTAQPKSPKSALRNQELFRSSVLPGGRHTLVMKFQTLDSIDYLETFSIQNQSRDQSGQPEGQDSVTKQIKPGVIAGATIGGFLGLLLILLGIFIYRRRVNRIRAVKPSPEGEIRGFDSTSQIAQPSQSTWERVRAWMNQTRSDIQRSITPSHSHSGSRRGGGPPPVLLSSTPPSPRVGPLTTEVRSTERGGTTQSAPSWFQHIYSRHQFYDTKEKGKAPVISSKDKGKGRQTDMEQKGSPSCSKGKGKEKESRSREKNRRKEPGQIRSNSTSKHVVNR
ncbi:hypothetical protein V5O48_012435 [Marasmius crinis-equi]|uniref:Uncharacterized protein n=1 Tax=Marasmius crinis-equi TaxID=585013 RepID=A0ABR3F2U0_9AGAR